MKHYVSNKKETPRMFENNFMEFFSRVHWTVPLIIFLPVITILAGIGMLKHHNTIGDTAMYAVFGLAFWTFTE